MMESVQYRYQLWLSREFIQVYNSLSVSIYSHKVSNASESLLDLPLMDGATFIIFTFRMKSLWHILR